MKTITVKARQTVYDIALEQYGTCEAVGEILALNPDVGNDPAALAAQGIDSVSETGFYLDVAVDKGAQLRIDDDSTLMRKNVLKEITSEITTYQYGTND
jgi:hypothetical protein